MVNVANEAMSEPHCVKSTVLKHYYLKLSPMLAKVFEQINEMRR